jgi:hypothetical protein
VSACYGTLGLTVFFGADSHFEYLAVMAAVVVPIVLPMSGKNNPALSLVAFRASCLTLVLGPMLQASLNFEPVLPANVIRAIVDSCIIVAAFAVFLVLRGLVNSLTSANRELDSLMQALPDTCLKIDSKGCILHVSGETLSLSRLQKGRTLQDAFGVESWTVVHDHLVLARETKRTLSFPISVNEWPAEIGRPTRSWPVQDLVRSFAPCFQESFV